MKTRRQILLLAGAAALIAACRAPQPATPASTPISTVTSAPEKVTLMLDWTPNTNHTGCYVALARGWYRDEGIALAIQQPGATVLPNQVVAERQALFG